MACCVRIAEAYQLRTSCYPTATVSATSDKSTFPDTTAQVTSTGSLGIRKVSERARPDLDRDMLIRAIISTHLSVRHCLDALQVGSYPTDRARIDVLLFDD